MRNPSRREFLHQSGTGLAAIATGSALAGNSLHAEEAAPCNVVMLISDEHNPKFSSVHGHPLQETPHLDRLAARGTVFESGYCPSPLCMPSRSAFVSGRRVHEIQCYNNCNVVAQEYPSYGAILADQGVHTVHLGKTDVYRPGRELGFSECLQVHDRQQPGDRKVQRKPLALRYDGATRAEGFGPVEGSPRASDDGVVEAALAWLKNNPQTLGKPFTLTANITMPHFPHHPTHALWEKYAAGATLAPHGLEQPTAMHPYAQDLRYHFGTSAFSEDQIRGHRRAYLGCVEYVDAQIGRFLDLFDQLNLWENTLFIYTSDHGEMLGKFGMWWKCGLYEDSVRVPVLAAGPGMAAGKRAKAPVDLLDVQATLFHATQAERPTEWSGVPLQDLQEASYNRMLFSEYHGHGTRDSAYMVRRGDWKLIWCADAPHLLFNLDEDPEELNNLAERHTGMRKELESQLYAICDPVKESQRAEAFINHQLKLMGMA